MKDSVQDMVSVIIPVFNMESYLAESIQSVLDNNYSPLEIIVIDDGSTDRSAEVATEFGDLVRVYREQHMGAVEARNMAIKLSKGELIAFHDADDLCCKERIQKQVACFKQEPKVDIVFTYLEQFISTDSQDSLAGKIRKVDGAQAGRCIGTMMTRREIFEKVGFFDASSEIAFFMSWSSLAEDLGLNIKMLSDVLLKRRIHQGNYNKNNKNQLALEYAKALKTLVDRRAGKK